MQMFGAIPNLFKVLNLYKFIKLSSISVLRHDKSIFYNIPAVLLHVTIIGKLQKC